MSHRCSAACAVALSAAVAAFPSGVAAQGSANSGDTAVALPEVEITSPKRKPAKQSTSLKPKPAAPAEPAAQADQSEPSTQEASATPLTVSGAATPGTDQFDITSKDIARLNPSDVRGLFRGEPGVQVGSSIPASQKVYVRGIEETNLAVTIDGALQNNKVFHHNATNFVDPSLLKAVRVDPGVAPADAGFGALAGSIAYETKDVIDLLDTDGFGATNKATFNTNGDVFTNSITTYGMHDGFEVLGYFNFGTSGNFEAGNGEELDGTATNFQSALGKFAYQAPSGDRFEISHERFKDDELRPFRANAGLIVPARPRPFEPLLRTYDITRQSTVFSYSDATPTPWWDPKVVLAFGNTSVTIPIFLRTETYDATGETDRVNGKAENTITTSFGTLVTGLDFNTSEASLADKFDPGKEKSAIGGAYAQARLEQLPGSRLSFGGRGDTQDFEGTTGESWSVSGASGNISGEQDLIGELVTAKAGYSHVWAGVPLAENFIINPNWIYLDGPEPVTSDNVTAGLRSRFNGFTVEGSVFRTEIDNARVATFAAFSAATGIYGALRARDIESEGFEIGAGYDWRDGFVRVKYAHIDVTIDGKPADSDTGNYIATPVGDIITVTAAHQFAGTGLTIGGDIEIAPEYDEVAPIEITGEVSKPYAAYEIVNLFAEYKTALPVDTRVRLDVRNVFNETYASRATYGQEFGNVTPLFEPGRAFVLSTTSRF